MRQLLWLSKLKLIDHLTQSVHYPLNCDLCPLHKVPEYEHEPQTVSQCDKMYYQIDAQMSMDSVAVNLVMKTIITMYQGQSHLFDFH